MSPTTEESDQSSLPPYGRVRSTGEIGHLVRQERKRQKLTLDDIYSVSGLTTRFLSEFERGKPNASLGRAMRTLQILGLELVVLPRGEADRFMVHRHRPDIGIISPVGKDE